MKLLPYQEKCVEKFFSTPYGLLVDLPPGVGKSIIFYRIARKVGGPLLLCSFPYVLYQHIEGVKKFIPEFTVQFPRKSKEVLPRVGDNTILMATPDYVRLKAMELLKLSFSMICLDESHMFKNGLSKRTKAILLICGTNPEAKKLLLTATPAPENIGEMQPQMECINEKILGNGRKFRKLFERKYFTGSFWKTYYVRQDYIKKRISPFIFSVPKKELPLPEQSTKIIKLQMPVDLRKIYNDYIKTCIIEVSEASIISTNMYTKTLQICAGVVVDTVGSKIAGKQVAHRVCDYKAKFIANMVKDLNYPVIIWANFREELRVMAEAIPRAKVIMGGTRHGYEILQEFKSGNLKVLIANTQCIGAGISLEVAGYQIAASRDPSCCRHLQSIGRTQRITQKKHVIRFEVMYENTMEERLYKKIQNKCRKLKNLREELWREELIERKNNGSI